MIILNDILSIALTAAPWLLIGFFAARLIKAFVPGDVLQRLVDGVVSKFGIEVSTQIGAVQELLPLWLEWTP